MNNSRKEVTPTADWISVEDRLPEIGEEVIVYCPECRHKVTALTRFIPYEGSCGYFWDNVYGGGFCHVQNSVTHWQPLPALPGVDNDD